MDITPQSLDGGSLEACLAEALDSLRATNEELVEVLALLAVTFQSGAIRGHIGRRALRALAEGQRAQRLLGNLRDVNTQVRASNADSPR
jgi:hypothetical protein